MWLEITDEGNYVVKMDEGPTRSLFISKYYRQRLATGQATAEEKEFIKAKITSAQWLIESIEQRRNTLTRVAQEIVDHQKDFFDNGPEFLKPLKMEQIAEKVKVHVTTVSRAVGEKWIETHRGILPLRMFFMGGTTTEGLRFKRQLGFRSKRSTPRGMSCENSIRVRPAVSLTISCRR